MIDLHDLARSARTYDIQTTFIAHPAPTLRKLANTLKRHWEHGFGSEYNPNRKEALEYIQVVSSIDEAIHQIDSRTGKLPKLISTSAKDGGKRVSFTETRSIIADGHPYLLMLGTGWGMADELLDRADYFLEPIKGPTEYNHLSVRSACAIMLDKLRGN